MFSNNLSTPFWPPAPKLKRKAFPKLQAVAPAERALRTCVPLLTPPSRIISNLSPTASEIAISDAVGDKLEIILDGGVRRGTHVLKALSAGATACSFGKAFLFSLGAGGQKGVERLLENMQKEIRRNMILMGCKSVKDLDETKIIYRN